MYLTLTNNIRSLSKYEYEALREMCRYSNNLYNAALYNIRQHYFAEKKFLRYESNYHLCKSNENYAMLQAGVAQQTLKVADRSFRSFFGLIEKAKKGDYRFRDIKMPGYREKGGLFNLILQANAIAIRDGFLKIPMSRKFLKTHREIRIPFPGILEGKEIKEIRICPVYKGRYFKVQYCYKEEVCDPGLDRSRALAIDPGIDNLATCVTTTGTSFIMDGRKLKSINRYWNKRIAGLQSIANKQGLKTTRQMQELTMKRNNRVKDCINKTARYIVDYCIASDIGTIVCGYNPDFKRSVNIGKKNSQNFVQIPHGDLRNTLKGLCERYCINYVEQEESYTSKASFPDRDTIPVYAPGSEAHYSFSGKRVSRGMYMSKDGTLLNADVNGALNILRKSSVVSIDALYGSGVLGTPVRIRVA